MKMRPVSLCFTITIGLGSILFLLRTFHVPEHVLNLSFADAVSSLSRKLSITIPYNSSADNFSTTTGTRTPHTEEGKLRHIPSQSTTSLDISPSLTNHTVSSFLSSSGSSFNAFHRILADSSSPSTWVTCETSRPIVAAYVHDYSGWRKGIGLISLILCVIVFFGGLAYFCIRSSSIYLETRGITLILPIAITGWSVIGLSIREAFGDNRFPCSLLYISSYCSGMALTAGLGARLLSLFSAQLAQVRVQKLMQTKEQVFLTQKSHDRNSSQSLSSSSSFGKNSKNNTLSEPYVNTVTTAGSAVPNALNSNRSDDNPGSTRVIVARHQSIRKSSQVITTNETNTTKTNDNTTGIQEPNYIGVVTDTSNPPSPISSRKPNVLPLVPRTELVTMKELEEPMYTSGTDSKSPPNTKSLNNHSNNNNNNSSNDKNPGSASSPVRMENLPPPSNMIASPDSAENFTSGTLPTQDEHDTVMKLHENNLINQFLSISIPLPRGQTHHSYGQSSNMNPPTNTMAHVSSRTKERISTITVTNEENPPHLMINQSFSRTHSSATPGLSTFASPVPNLSETTLLRMMNAERQMFNPNSAPSPSVHNPDDTNNNPKLLSFSSTNGYPAIETPYSAEVGASVATIMPLSSSVENYAFAEYRWIRFIEYFRFHQPGGQILSFVFLSIPWILAIIVNLWIDSSLIYGNYDTLPIEYSHAQREVPWTGRCGCYMGQRHILFFGCWGFASIFIYTIMYRYSLSLFTKNHEDIYHIREELIRLFIIETICGTVYFIGKWNDDWNIVTFSSDYAILIAILLQQILMLWIPANIAGTERWILATKSKLRSKNVRSGRTLLFNRSKASVHDDHNDEDDDDIDDIDTINDNVTTAEHSPIVPGTTDTSPPEGTNAASLPYRLGTISEGSTQKTLTSSSPKESIRDRNHVPWMVRWFPGWYRFPGSPKPHSSNGGLLPSTMVGSQQDYANGSSTVGYASSDQGYGKSIRRMLVLTPHQNNTPAGSIHLISPHRHPSPPLGLTRSNSSSTPPSFINYDNSTAGDNNTNGENSIKGTKLHEPNNEPPVSFTVRDFDVRQIASRAVNSVFNAMEIQVLTYSLVYTRIGRSHFKELLAQEFAMENLLFLMDALSFRQLLWTRNYRHRTTTNSQDRHRHNAHDVLHPLTRTSSGGDSPPLPLSFVSDNAGPLSHLTDHTHNSSGQPTSNLSLQQQQQQQHRVHNNSIHESDIPPKMVSSTRPPFLGSQGTSGTSYSSSVSDHSHHPSHSLSPPPPSILQKGLVKPSSENKIGEINTPVTDFPSPTSLAPSTYISHTSSLNKGDGNDGGTTPRKTVPVPIVHQTTMTNTVHDVGNISPNQCTYSNTNDYDDKPPVGFTKSSPTNDDIRMNDILTTHPYHHITRSQTSPDTGTNHKLSSSSSSHPLSSSVNNSENIPHNVAGQMLQATIVTASVHGSIDNYAKFARFTGDVNTLPLGHDMHLTKYVHTENSNTVGGQKDSSIYKLRKDAPTSLSLSSSVPSHTVTGAGMGGGGGGPFATETGGGGIPYHTSDHTGASYNAHTRTASDTSSDNIVRTTSNRPDHSPSSSLQNRSRHHHSSSSSSRRHHHRTHHYYDPRHVVMEEDLIECAVHLAERYIDEGGEFPVNIAATTARRILRRIRKGIITIDLFWEAELEVFTLLSRGPIVRFTTKPKLWNKWTQEYLLHAIRRDNQRQVAVAKQQSKEKKLLSFPEKMKSSLSLSRAKGSFHMFSFGSSASTPAETLGINKVSTSTKNSNTSTNNTNALIFNMNTTNQILPEESPSQDAPNGRNDNGRIEVSSIYPESASNKSFSSSLPLTTSDQNPPVQPSFPSFGFFRRKSGTYPDHAGPNNIVTNTETTPSTGGDHTNNNNTLAMNKSNDNNNDTVPGITATKRISVESVSTVSSLSRSNNNNNGTNGNTTATTANNNNDNRRSSQESGTKRRSSQESPSNPSVLHDTTTVVTSHNGMEPRRISIFRTPNSPFTVSSSEPNNVSPRRLSSLSSPHSNNHHSNSASPQKDEQVEGNMILPLAVFPEDDTPENTTDHHHSTLPGFIPSGKKN